VIRVAAGRIEAVRLSGDTVSEGWLRDYLLAERDVTPVRQRLLVPGAQAPAGFVVRGRVLCNCYDVAETEVRAALSIMPGSAQEALVGVAKQLQCGTRCGSCLPELRRLAAERRPLDVPVAA
jgi:assimilatory nitrate reductase catalytic subunit